MLKKRKKWQTLIGKNADFQMKKREKAIDKSTKPIQCPPFLKTLSRRINHLPHVL